ncbi:MAG: phosphopantothenoylcysteine decarboxylase [Candidatus Omnitrophota bacterium]|nr:phosphopantothenoylcysteine decarboxylase [Candidatus Omnitrophota bacterium]MDZ4241873.1 phosphopantothenoylcysteine decarboxylase [Candidatus Omnitrophota bacterium]
MSLKNKKILITCGPTWVPVDGVRVLSNISTGEMGHRLADRIAAAGGKVTLLEGPVTHAYRGRPVKIKKYLYFDELKRLLESELRKAYDAVIHAAAVSDYRLKKTRAAKIRSDAKRLTLTLVPTEKLIDRIRARARLVVLVGFKLETVAGNSRLLRNARALLKRAGCDFVVANTLANGYRGWVFGSSGRVLAKASSRNGLAKQLIRLMKERLP